jgi:uncharacterized protein YggE
MGHSQKTKKRREKEEIIMKKVYLILFVILFSISAMAEDKSQIRLITVTGSAEVRVVPDEVVLTFGVEILNKELQVAKNKCDRVSTKIINLGKKYNTNRRLAVLPRHLQMKVL